jgi:hypothetical protein
MAMPDEAPGLLSPTPLVILSTSGATMASAAGNSHGCPQTLRGFQGHPKDAAV